MILQDTMSENSKSTTKWHHPSEVMKLHKMKQKKKALQARIKCNISNEAPVVKPSAFDDVFLGKKRKNPFVKTEQGKKCRIESSPQSILNESTDQTLFKLIHQSSVNNSLGKPDISYSLFSNILNQNNEKTEHVEIVKAEGEKWLPIDWTLKSKMRLLSAKPFPWNNKLKISEESSGVTAFTRCLDNNSATMLDTSPNAKFYRCSLVWQQPSLPWLTLFPRNNQKSQNSPTNSMINSCMRDSLRNAWSDSLRSLFQLIRTGHCPYFYVCANNFTVLFRAAGMCGFSDIHVLITPTTRGFRELLKEEDIEYKMPLKTGRESDQGYETLDLPQDELEEADEHWLKSLGVNQEDIKQINYTQERKVHKAECEVDNSEQSLVLIEGIEVQGFYNFLLNCKSTIALTGPLASVPPTLLAPVAFHGASLHSLKVRETKVNIDNEDYYSLEMTGPILPTMIHNLFAISTPEQCLTVTFNNLKLTEPFSKLRSDERISDVANTGCVVFRIENLSDCGLLPEILKHFCTPDNSYVTNVECLKYSSENKTYTWT